MQYLSILQKFTILELEGAAVVVGDRFLQLKEASEETDLGKEYLKETIGKILKNELDTVKSKEVCKRTVTYHRSLHSSKIYTTVIFVSIKKFANFAKVGFTIFSSDQFSIATNGSMPKLP